MVDEYVANAKEAIDNGEDKSGIFSLNIIVVFVVATTGITIIAAVVIVFKRKSRITPAAQPTSSPTPQAPQT